MKLLSPFGPRLGLFNLDIDTNHQLLQVCITNKDDTEKQVNHLLVGYIRKEFDIFHDLKSNKVLFETLKIFVLDYLNSIEGPYSSYKPFKKVDIECTGAWCNIQKFGEFNPIHNHPATDLVCVIYPKISIDKEQNIFNLKNYIPGGVHFVSESSDMKFSSHIFETLPIQGSGYVFPGTLMHYTSPLYNNDDERWSVSLNFNFTQAWLYHKSIQQKGK